MRLNAITVLRSLAIVVTLGLVLSGCGGGGGSSTSGSVGGSTVAHNLWVWMSGSSAMNQNPVYGTKGVAAATNMPGARYGSNSWIDSSGNRWLFGGVGFDSTGAGGVSLNDLWKFDGANWTWVSGSNVGGQHGVYGTLGAAAASNIPGARVNAVSWIDGSGNLWLFGGSGYGAASLGDLNDLWKFDGTNWTWVSGSNASYQSGVYGTLGTAAPTNVPGARDSAVSWIDGNGKLWLFGGQGRDSTGFQGSLNDLWKFDGANWTWVSGSNVANQSGVYGTKGTAAAANIPGARNSATSWTDSSGNRWLFGGDGYDSSGISNVLNDLWKFDGANWTWVSGSNVYGQRGNYGTLGTAAASNIPGARVSAAGWIDGNGKLWLFGGNGYDTNGQLGSLNDLWKFDGTNWTWMTGSNINGQLGNYGAQGIAASSNTPGGRYSAVNWIDGSGKLWLFGGFLTNAGVFNDLWFYQP